MKTDFPARGSITAEHMEDTQAFGAKLGAALEAGDVVILDGPLGAGKTTLTQGIVRGMGVEGRVTSPTFVIARVHPSISSGPDLVHVDAYRLVGESGDPVGELDALDLDTDLERAVVVAEWGSGLVEQIAGRLIQVTLDRHSAVETDPDSEARIITWTSRVADHAEEHE